MSNRSPGCESRPHQPHRTLPRFIQDYECLVEFIAVSPQARGQGVGSALLRWAETFATRALLMRWPSTVAARSSIRMTLWVSGGLGGGDGC